jgi:putative endonuclease
MNPNDRSPPSSPCPAPVARMERGAIRGQPRPEMKGAARITGRKRGPPSGLRAEGGEGADDAPRRIAFRFGLSAESRAAAFLIAKGYRILARRFRTPLGEIDIVARRRGVLVFVEVKARDSFDAAAEAIGRRQQNRIVSAAQLWLAAHPEDAMRDMRFDVVLVVPGRLPRHLQAAFDASL